MPGAALHVPEFGSSVMLDCIVSDPAILEDFNFLRSVMSGVMDWLGSEVFMTGAPYVFEGNSPWDGGKIIAGSMRGPCTTVSISAFPEKSWIFFDLFSGYKFDVTPFEDIVLEALGVTEYERHAVHRGRLLFPREGNDDGERERERGAEAQD